MASPIARQSLGESICDPATKTLLKPTVCAYPQQRERVNGSPSVCVWTADSCDCMHARSCSHTKNKSRPAARPSPAVRPLHCSLASPAEPFAGVAAITDVAKLEAKFHCSLLQHLVCTCAGTYRESMSRTINIKGASCEWSGRQTRFQHPMQGRRRHAVCVSWLRCTFDHAADCRTTTLIALCWWAGRNPLRWLRVKLGATWSDLLQRRKFFRWSGNCYNGIRPCCDEQLRCSACAGIQSERPFYDVIST